MRAAVIGVGSMGQNHARVYATLEDVELVAVADNNFETAVKVGKRYNAKPYQDYHVMLDKENIDLVSIAVPTKLHKEVALTVLDKNIHVLLEKPIASTEADAREIIQAAESSPTAKLMIGHIERFNMAVMELKKRLHELGDIYKIDVQRIGPFPKRITDIGVITDLSVHDLDIIHFLTNSNPKRIFAEIQRRLHPLHEDSVTALIKYDNEALAVLNINYLSPTKTRLLKVFGKKGMFKVDYLTQELYFYENNAFLYNDWNSVSEGDMRKIIIPKREPLQVEIEAFIDCIKKDKDPPVDGLHGLKILKTANQIMQSANYGEIIKL